METATTLSAGAAVPDLATASSRSRVLVVIPTLDEAAHIERVLERLLSDAPAFCDLRVVVVDGGSTDGTTELVERLSERDDALHLIHNPRRIQSAGVNLAVRRFGQDADVLVRCDAHALYPPRFCERLLTTLTEKSADSVVVTMDSVGDTCLQRAVAWISNSPLGTGGSKHRAGRQSGFVDHGHHAAFRMDMFTKVGGYDETFTHNEDAEFDCRQRALGAKVYLDAGIRLGYHPRDNLRELGRQYFRYGLGRSRTVRRHPKSIRLRQLAVPAHLVVSLVAMVVSPWFPLLLAWPVLYLTVLAAASVCVAARQGCRCGLLAGPAAFVMHTAWALGFLWGLFARRERVWRPEQAVSLWSPAPEGWR